MDWRKVYQLPFISDGTYVWADNETMTFTFDFDFAEKSNFVDNIVKKLNGDSNIKFDKKFTLRNYIDFDYGEEYAFCIRGWGVLTCNGGFNLSQNEAENVQNDFAKWVLETLNS